MNEKIKELAKEAGLVSGGYANGTKIMTWRESFDNPGSLEKFAELIVKQCASEYNKLINGEAVVLPKDREHAEALVRVGMFYLENNK